MRSTHSPAKTTEVERAVAAEMITALYRALGTKPDEFEGMLAGVLDVIEGDEIARASGLWRPLNVTPAVLALACRKLIATAKWVKPAELREACEEAGRMLRFAQQAADRIRKSVRKADAILLEFAYDEWQRPWLLPEYRPMLERMLRLHWCSEQWEEGRGDWDDDGTFEPSTFVKLVRQEQAKLEALEAAPQPKRIAAARKRSEHKRSKPKARSRKLRELTAAEAIEQPNGGGGAP